MKEEFNLSDNNKIIIVKGNIEEQKGDVILIWSSINLNSGPEAFYRIHRKAGSQLATSALISGNISEGDAFSTIAGLLDFNLAIHAILPSQNHLFNITFFNIINTLKTYKKNNICRNIYLTFPGINYNIVIDNLLLYEKELKEFSFFLIAENDNEFEKSIAYLKNKCKKTLWNRINILKHIKNYIQHIKMLI